MLRLAGKLRSEQVFYKMKSSLLSPLLVIVLALVLERAPSRCYADDNIQSIQQILRLDNRWFNTSVLENDAPKVCCHPDSLQGIMHSYDLSSSSMTLTRFFHDAQNGRLALLVTAPSESGSEQRTVITCTSDRICIVSTINDQAKQCTKKKVNDATLDSFWNRCIPRGATKREPMRMGNVPPLKVLLWEFTNKVGKYNKIVAANGCVPVAEVVTKSNGRESTYYFDADTKIKDKKVFDIPSFCTNTEE